MNTTLYTTISTISTYSFSLLFCEITEQQQKGKDLFSSSFVELVCFSAVVRLSDCINAGDNVIDESASLGFL